MMEFVLELHFFENEPYVKLADHLQMKKSLEYEIKDLKDNGRQIYMDTDQVFKENRKLREENENLRTTNQQNQSFIKTLTNNREDAYKHCASRNMENDELKKEIVKLKKDNDELKRHSINIDFSCANLFNNLRKCQKELEELKGKLNETSKVDCTNSRDCRCWSCIVA